MSDATAALVAALIGASAAVLAGGLAIHAALKQVSKSAVTQREQAFWELRRDAYAKALVSYRGFERVAWEFNEAAKTEEVSSLKGLLDKMDNAAYSFEESKAVLDISVPEDSDVARAVRNVNDYITDAMMVVELWYEGSPNPDGWSPRYASSLSKVGDCGSVMVDALRDDLAKDVEPATRSGRTLRDWVPLLRSPRGSRTPQL
ncbi:MULTISPECIES: hypothetical protein [unclassified Streptomyces]|uniref:hypothetical protein n=1 Tax=unclassified Streptomyces TaxID=2593676 RepID=UPI00131E90C0|nr:hypothetical protein [Streptomyces sp. CB01635]